jgi:hypothetical protein
MKANVKKIFEKNKWGAMKIIFGRVFIRMMMLIHSPPYLYLIT